MQEYIPLENLEIYQLSMEIGRRVWLTVDNWGHFAKFTIGKQFVNAADSIAANISEGYGRFHYKDKKQFYYIARASLFESKTWATKSLERALLTPEEFNHLHDLLVKAHQSLNAYIKSIPSA